MATLAQIIEFAIEYNEAHVGDDGSGSGHEVTWVIDFIDSLANADFEDAAETAEEAPEEWEVEEAAHELLSILGVTGESAWQQYVAWKEAGRPPRQDAEDSDWDASRKKTVTPSIDAERRSKKR